MDGAIPSTRGAAASSTFAAGGAACRRRSAFSPTGVFRGRPAHAENRLRVAANRPARAVRRSRPLHDPADADGAERRHRDRRQDRIRSSIVVKDSQSNPNRAGEVANDLILKDKVDIMLVSGTPETANPVSDVCELNEMPCVSTVVPWQPWFFGRKGDPKKGFRYHVSLLLGTGRRDRRLHRHVAIGADQSSRSAACFRTMATATHGATPSSAFRPCSRKRASR